MWPNYLRDPLQKTVIILRGLPGSGKSTLARILKLAEAAWVSADHYFERHNGKQREYTFDRAQLPAAHGQCLLRFIEAMDKGAPFIVVDNTNITREEFARYTKLGEENGYLVLEVTLGDPTNPDVVEGRSIHGVPQFIIEKRSQKWER